MNVCLCIKKDAASFLFSAFFSIIWRHVWKYLTYVYPRPTMPTMRLPSSVKVNTFATSEKLSKTNVINKDKTLKLVLHTSYRYQFPSIITYHFRFILTFNFDNLLFLAALSIQTWFLTFLRLVTGFLITNQPLWKYIDFNMPEKWLKSHAKKNKLFEFFTILRIWKTAWW